MGVTEIASTATFVNLSSFSIRRSTNRGKAIEVATL